MPAAAPGPALDPPTLLPEGTRMTPVDSVGRIFDTQ